ncbi:PDZ/DHR/GLGF domain-containing protein [Pseudonocardia dioxanivorans CB1190]|uniref:PDZ/DHR/GLGF domain-containing protein n=2 Tax=Pseudonocardia dioxanivorans TaxID=240495 RepID=F4CZF0_PSEUX|nr:PDZ/DHR/GLGF domain-containing protein [Pseudonocardia dioxanivorans CB1190]
MPTGGPQWRARRAIETAPRPVQRAAMLVAPPRGEHDSGDEPALIVPGARSPLEAEFASVIADVRLSAVDISRGGGAGSDLVLDDQGHLVTNAHVVGITSTEFEVRMHEQRRPRGQAGGLLPGRGPGGITVADPSPLVWRRRASARPVTCRSARSWWRWVAPLGLEGSVTQGIVPLGRTIPEPPEPQNGVPGTVLRQVIRTSAPINRDNSGGALVSLDREVVGVPPLAGASPRTVTATPGFGLTMSGSVVHDIARQTIEHGRVVDSGQVALGATVAAVTDDRGEPVGAGVADVDAAGPSAAAGAQVGDLIIRAHGDATTGR